MYCLMCHCFLVNYLSTWLCVAVRILFKSFNYRIMRIIWCLLIILSMWYVQLWWYSWYTEVQTSRLPQWSVRFTVANALNNLTVQFSCGHCFLAGNLLVCLLSVQCCFVWDSGGRRPLTLSVPTVASEGNPTFGRRIKSINFRYVFHFKLPNNPTFFADQAHVHCDSPS